MYASKRVHTLSSMLTQKLFEYTLDPANSLGDDSKKS